MQPVGTALPVLFRFPGGDDMDIRKMFFDYEYREVLDMKTRELIRVACAVAVQCPD
jgi:alkylhydroperoxidase/carboxymuconolactone decarboxylase family protein YurZ